MKILSLGRRKTFLIVVSALFAIVLWIIITYTENPQIDVKLNSVSVTVTGENNLTERNLMIINKQSMPTASVVVRGTRKDLIGIIGNITATIDVSDIGSTGTYHIRPIFDIPSNAVYISKRETMDVTVEVGQISQKEIPVEVVQVNAEKNKSFIIESLPETDVLQIRGYRSDITQIEHASLYIDVSSMVYNNTTKYDIVFEAADGTEFKTENSIFSDYNKVSVKNNVYDALTLGIKVNLPDIDNNQIVRLVSSEFSDIKVGVKSEEGKKAEFIPAFIDIGKLVEGTNKYSALLTEPDGIYLPNDKKQMTVEVEVFKTEQEQQ